MARHPNPSAVVHSMPGAVFSRIAHRLRTFEGELFPLHVGDTFMEPFAGGRMQDLRVGDHPGMHRYTSPQGLPALIDAALEKVRTRNGIPCERGSIMVTAGATGALGAALGMLADPGDEVLILAPYWPLIRGIVQCAHARPVEVPFFGHVHSADQAVAAIEQRIGPRTVALYVSTPSNPTGLVMPLAWLQAIAELARRRGLWLLSDEVYEDYVYAGEHHSIGALAPERTLTSFSFSKAYGMAGNRTGYLVGPPDAVAGCRKMSTHSYYSAPTSGQLAGLMALQEGEGWLKAARRSYGDTGRRVAEILGEPTPQGSTFLFLDVSERLDERGVFGFLEDALDRGLVLAPGPSFGAGCEGHVRICYTSAPPDRVLEAARRLAAMRAGC